MAHRGPERPVAPSNSPARRAIPSVTETTVILASTRCTAASRAPPRSASVNVIALTATRAPRLRALSSAVLSFSENWLGSYEIMLPAVAMA